MVIIVEITPQHSLGSTFLSVTASERWGVGGDCFTRSFPFPVLTLFPFSTQYDFFLTRDRPNGTSTAAAAAAVAPRPATIQPNRVDTRTAFPTPSFPIAPFSPPASSAFTGDPGSITDEVTIDLACNAGFPGSQPPGCLDQHSKYGNTSRRDGPVRRNAVWDGHHHYDLWYTDHHDAVPGTGTRYTAFRRVGADVPGAQPPLRVDVRPFIDALRREWPGEQVGPWLGHIALGTELYDHVAGSVRFHSVPTFEPVPV